MDPKYKVLEFLTFTIKKIFVGKQEDKMKERQKADFFYNNNNNIKVTLY